jgi:toxin ParE1/3/4
MANVVRTPRADQDLGQVVRYIAKDNLSAAVSWLDEVEALFQLLATQPEMGQRWQSKSLGEVRRLAHGKYVIYYLPIADGVEIVRVLHGAREQGRLL